MPSASGSSVSASAIDSTTSTKRIVTSRRNCIAGLRERRLLEQERLVLTEDRCFELAQVGPWIDAELLDERLPRGAVGGERVGLPARAVERKHELCARTLSQGLRGDERFQLGDELGVPPEREVGLDPLLERDRAELLEPRDLRLRERLVEEVGERGTAPERERLAQSALGRDGISAFERGAPILCEPREAVEIDALGRRARARSPARVWRSRGRAPCGAARRRPGRRARRSRVGRRARAPPRACRRRRHGPARARARRGARAASALRVWRGRRPARPPRGRGAVRRALGCLPRSLRPFVVPRSLCAVAPSHGCPRISIPVLSRS